MDLERVEAVGGRVGHGVLPWVLAGD
jgi:hypothetical protein